MRWLWVFIGHIFVALGALGVVLPLIPTTPFLLVALGCYFRGSPRFAAWLLAHRLFGPPLHAWRERGAIRRRDKWLATFVIIGGVCVPLFVLELSLLGRAGALVGSLAAIIFIQTRPGA